MQGEEARADPRPSNPRLGRAGNEVKSQPLLLAPEQGCEGQAEPCGVVVWDFVECCGSGGAVLSVSGQNCGYGLGVENGF